MTDDLPLMDDQCKSLKITASPRTSLPLPEAKGQTCKEPITSQPTNTSYKTLSAQIKIDPVKVRYPYCIVWTPIPLISWLLPFIGHIGIGSSEGVIYDFAGPYYVSVNDMAFGSPTKYTILSLSEEEKNKYNNAIEFAMEKFRKMNYSFCCNNCHSFVAACLNKMKYNGKNDYGMISTWNIITWKSKYVGCCSFLKTYAGFFFILIIVFLVVLFVKIL